MDWTRGLTRHSSFTNNWKKVFAPAWRAQKRIKNMRVQILLVIKVPARKHRSIRLIHHEKEMVEKSILRELLEKHADSLSANKTPRELSRAWNAKKVMDLVSTGLMGFSFALTGPEIKKLLKERKIRGQALEYRGQPKKEIKQRIRELDEQLVLMAAQRRSHERK